MRVWLGLVLFNMTPRRGIGSADVSGFSFPPSTAIGRAFRAGPAEKWSCRRAVTLTEKFSCDLAFKEVTLEKTLGFTDLRNSCVPVGVAEEITDGIPNA